MTYCDDGAPGAGDSEIYAMNPDGANPTNLTNDPGIDDFSNFSPDGKKIAVSSDRSGTLDIYMMNASDGSSKERLIKNTAFDTYAAWSPDGKRIAFASQRGGDYEVFVMKANQPEGKRNRAKNLTKNPAVDYAPDWQPLMN
jgi:TolB protein